jgi:anthranilate phosphoribosyltransferase
MARGMASMPGGLTGDLARLAPPADRMRPVLLPAYGVARGEPNLTALVALMLKRFGASVLVHGRTDGAADARGATTAQVLEALSVPLATTIAEAQTQFGRESFAFVPVDVLAPRLARRLREERDADRVAFEAAQLLDPFGGAGFRVVCAPGPRARDALCEQLAASRADALLVENASGEPFPDTGRPRLEAFADGVASVVWDDARASGATGLPPADVPATAAWIRAALEGSVPVPDAVVAEIGACLDGARRLGARR